MTTELKDATLPTKDDAIRAAWKILGIDGELPTAECELITIQDDDTPFFAAQLNGTKVWRAVFKNLSIPAISAGNTVSRTRVLTLRVDLKPQTGALVRIRSDWPEGEPQPLPRAMPAAAAESIRATTEEWIRLADEAPATTLSVALGAIDEGIGGIASAKDINAYVIWSSELKREMKKVWSIEFRGVQPVKPVDSSRRDAANHLRHIVRDDNGQWLHAGNTPHPKYPTQNGSAPSEPKKPDASKEPRGK